MRGPRHSGELNSEPSDLQTGALNAAAPPPVWPVGGARPDQAATEKRAGATRTQSPSSSFSGCVDLTLAHDDKRWLRMADESGRERGVLQLGDGGHIELVGTSGDFGASVPLLQAPQILIALFTREL